MTAVKYFTAMPKAGTPSVVHPTTRLQRSHGTKCRAILGHAKDCVQIFKALDNRCSWLKEGDREARADCMTLRESVTKQHRWVDYAESGKIAESIYGVQLATGYFRNRNVGVNGREIQRFHLANDSNCCKFLDRANYISIPQIMKVLQTHTLSYIFISLN